LAAVGCGHHRDLPPVAQVEGVVTLDGKPVPRGMVQFVPDESKGTKGPPAVGVIDENGHYELTTAVYFDYTPNSYHLNPWHAASFHPGGVNVLFADGSVHLISETIDLPTRKAFATVAGREIIGTAF